MAAFVTLSVGSTAFADTSLCPSGTSALDCQAVVGGWQDWVPDNGQCGGVAADSSLAGNDNVQKIMNYFIGQGLTVTQAAGIAGNIQSESAGTFNPKIVQGTPGSPFTFSETITPGLGYGLSQWTASNRQQNLQTFANQEGLPIYSLKLQLDFIWHELTGDYKASTLTPLQASTTYQQATDIVMLNYEGPQDQSTAAQNARETNAKNILTTFESANGGATQATTTSTDTTGEDDSCVGSDVLGTGTGQFTTDTSVSYPGVQKMIANAMAEAENKTPSSAGGSIYHLLCDPASQGGPECANMCMHNVGALWGYSGSGYEDPNDLWDQFSGTSHEHTDRNPPVGALLIYQTSSVGHVVIYLGNNLVISTDAGSSGSFDAGQVNIVSAQSIESGSWSLTYRGWVDPIFYGTLGYGSVTYSQVNY